MELNLTYEQSKEILGLGYDFSSICTKFELKADTEYRVVYGRPVERGSRKEIESSESMEGDGRIVHLRNRSMLDPLMIPIIPEAALLKCLNLYVDGYDPEGADDSEGKGAVIYWRKDRDVYHAIQLMRGLIMSHSVYNKQNIMGCSIYAGFLWCHQHYPEELKAKFDEVMG